MFTKSGQSGLIIWLFVVVAVFLVLGVNSHKEEANVTAVSYSQILEIISESSEKKQPAQLTIEGNRWKLNIKDQVYTTVAPLTDEFLKTLSTNKNLEIRFVEPKPPSPWIGAFITWLPFLVIFYFIYRFFKNMPDKGAAGGMWAASYRRVFFFMDHLALGRLCLPERWQARLKFHSCWLPDQTS